MTSPASISGAGELNQELLCEINPVLLLFQFSLYWLTVLAEKPVIGVQNPIKRECWWVIVFDLFGRQGRIIAQTDLKLMDLLGGGITSMHHYL